MNYLKLCAIFLIAITSGCGGPSIQTQINEAINAGECRNAEALIEGKYKGQQQLYKKAMLYINCDKNKKKGVKVLKKLADADYLPALERIIEYDLASKQQQLRYRYLKYQASVAAYERRKAISESMMNLSCNRAIGGLGCSSGSSNKRAAQMPNILKRLTKTGKTFDGKTLCYYNDGSVKNIGYVGVCPMN